MADQMLPPAGRMTPYKLFRHLGLPGGGGWHEPPEGWRDMDETALAVTHDLLHDAGEGTTRPHAHWPACVAGLPVCPVRGLPVPYSSGTDPGTGAGKFGANDLMAKMACAIGGLCGVCGQPLGDGQIVFIAVAKDFAAMRDPVFGDPPNHEVCADAAMALCPHIARPGRGKPGWVLVTCAGYDVEPGGLLVAFRPGPVTSIRRFAYDRGALAEVTR